MVRIGKLTDYAIVLSTQMAQRPEDLHSVRGLSESTKIPSPTVSKVLKQLVRAGIFSSERGVNGGYRMNGMPAEVSIAEIIEAMEGPIALTECSIPSENPCDRQSDGGAHTNWALINTAVFKALSTVSLADMNHSESAKLVPLQLVKHREPLEPAAVESE
ncbi:MAG: SUF system Fe-S cluster assembly regulator [Myxococcales bacterium]|nr:MAG: SUF system Fe-S cluster assembly regulator [Myxococcales bacterium]